MSEDELVGINEIAEMARVRVGRQAVCKVIENLLSRTFIRHTCAHWLGIRTANLSFSDIAFQVLSSIS
jgi:hypothetical protein